MAEIAAANFAQRLDAVWSEDLRLRRGPASKPRRLCAEFGCCQKLPQNAGRSRHPPTRKDASSRSELPKTSSETLSGWILGQRRQEDAQENAKRNLPKMQQALPQQRLKAEARREWTAGSHNSSLRGKFEHACVLAMARDDFLCTAQALSAELRSLANLKMPGSQREKCTCTHGLLRFLGCDGHLPGPGPLRVREPQECKRHIAEIVLHLRRQVQCNVE